MFIGDRKINIILGLIFKLRKEVIIYDFERLVINNIYFYKIKVKILMFRKLFYLNRILGCYK